MRIPLQFSQGSWGTSGVSTGESVLVSRGGMHVRFPPELYQQCHASLRVDQGICGFPSRLSHEAFPRGVPTGQSHVPPWCESILGLKVEVVQGKQVSLEWTETSGGLWEWWHDPGVPLAFPVESASSCVAMGTPGILSHPRRERIPPLELGGRNGAPLDVGRTLVLPFEWRRYVVELLELQQRCEGPFESSRG